MPKDTKSLGNNKAPACESRGFVLKKKKVRILTHLHINYYQAKVIVEYRKKKGILTNLKQLSLYEEFNTADFERITPYICYE